MPLPYVVIDFETASRAKLEDVGAWRYAEDPSTEVLCLAGLEPGGEPWVWTPRPFDLASHLADLLADRRIMVIAHNVQFEKAIWRHIMMPKYGFPDIPNQRWHDTQAMCAMRRLPLRLEDAVKILGLHTPKDAEGRALVLKLSRNYRQTGVLDCNAVTLDRVIAYCVQDVRAEMALHLALGSFPPGERQVWLLDQEINERGVVLDQVFVEASQNVLDLALPDLEREFAELTGGLRHGQRAKFLSWLRWGQGVRIADMKKKTVDKLLGKEAGDDDEDRLVGNTVAEDDDEDDAEIGRGLSDLPRDAHRALSLRSLMRSTSVTKLRRMASCVSGDGRARGLLQYHGAGPGRWAGRLLQPQNFPRGSNPPEIGPDLVVETILTAARSKSCRHVELCLGNPPFETVASSLRHALVPAPGHMFAAGDFAQIEARVVLALAGQDDKVALFASGAPIYADMAEHIFGHSVTKADNLEKYTIGKNTVLGCGFQMAGGTFQQRYAEKHTIEFCDRVVEVYRKDWAPRVPVLWYGLEEAAMRAVVAGAGRATHCGPFEFQMGERWLAVRLPSNRRLWYFDPQIELNRFDKEGVTFYQGRGRRDIYGGKWAENVSQALARDIMVDAMLKCQAEGLAIVLTVHDEIVVESPRQDAAVALKQIMEDSPAWAKKLHIPVAAETWQGTRYKK